MRSPGYLRRDRGRGAAHTNRDWRLKPRQSHQTDRANVSSDSKFPRAVLDSAAAGRSSVKIRHLMRSYRALSPLVSGVCCGLWTSVAKLSLPTTRLINPGKQCFVPGLHAPVRCKIDRPAARICISCPPVTQPGKQMIPRLAVFHSMPLPLELSALLSRSGARCANTPQVGMDPHGRPRPAPHLTC